MLGTEFNIIGVVKSNEKISEVCNGKESYIEIIILNDRYIYALRR
jgi:hypothetical protein